MGKENDYVEEILKEKKFNLPGVPGRLLFLLTGFELGLGLGFAFEFGSWGWTKVPLMLEGTEKASSEDIIFGTEENWCVLS